MALFSQERRHIRITTPLGKDVLHLESLSGSEAMSRLFNLELSLLSENQSISFQEIVGKGVTIAIDLPWSGKRFFNGIVSRFGQQSGDGTAGGDTRVSRYRATVVPWFWLLSRSAESRIHQDKSVPDIVEKVFRDHGFSDFEMRLQGTYLKREFCVQYRETHFNFISRLLEEEGIHYFFEHSNGKHKMILADAPQANVPCPEQNSASYQVHQSGNRDEDVITSLEKMQEIRPGKYALNDYNFEIPGTALTVELPGRFKLGPGEREIYDYPGEYSGKAQGDGIARVRMEEEEAQITSIVGSSSCRAFASGYRFTLNNFYLKEMNGKEYVLTSVQHQASQALQTGGDFEYGNRFTCIPAEIPFRPQRLTSKPGIYGAQTASVVGPAGEEIYTDQHARVKLQFHWDREGKRDEKSSCWVRVSQLWAGAGWGAMFIPRIGQEVVVDFLEGDPDRPLVTGRVYNGNNVPPYPLPAEKTKSTIKSNSSKGGGGYNEIRFEDKKGSEELYFQAEKDQNVLVKNDQGIVVGNDRAESVTRDRSLEVGRDKSETVHRNKSIQVLGGHTEQVTGSMSIMVGSTLTETVAINYAETVGGAMELSVGGALAITVGAAMAETVGGAKVESVGITKSQNIGSNKSVNIRNDYSENIGNNKSVTVTKDLEETVGGQHRESVTKEYILSARKVQIIGEDEVSIKAGSAEIIMKKNGDITIKGKKINVTGSGDVIIKGSKVLGN